MRASRRSRIPFLLTPALLLSLAPAFSQTAEPPARKQGTFEFYLGRYKIPDSRFKAVYEPGGGIRGLFLSSSLPLGFDVYAEIKEFHKTGKLTYTLEETNFLLVPLSLGVRYIYPGGILMPYIGGGADFYFYYESNSIAKTMNIVSGAHLLTGIYLQFGRNSPVRLNGRIKFTKLKAREGEIEVELGGFEYGVGLAIAF
jgi:hypothetical protein